MYLDSFKTASWKSVAGNLSSELHSPPKLIRFLEDEYIYL